ncbi:uncharacterized protein BXZ73DRAFT_82314 [Epithele typhae]|uniref:uncharacterized protein n=1 Tax=Epithele typhae TaxID=378194 RepID=UPI0020080AE3|nr:uncharacterized protein BXZ73DRAFT_82314 [Epithele typhae]KAH9912477.1 hypothetical protein BXZ73DRAFT_82314 [Epithele typhae]
MLPLLLLAVLPLLVCSQVRAASFTPASIPLAVRSPYVNAWQISTNGSAPLSNSWANFWSQTVPDLGWRGKIRIDGTVYNWMGGDLIPPTANITAVQVTPTRSIYSMQVGPMTLTITFLSPLEPSDWVKQSIPLSYVALEVTANDNAVHTVQVYSDITAVQWLSPNLTSPVNWTSVTTSSSIYHEVDFITPAPFTELSDRAMDGRAFYATAAVPNLSWQVGESPDARNNFNTSGHLPNTVLNTQPPHGLDFLVFGLAIDLGTISKTSQPVSWVVGNLRNPAIRYVTPTGETQDRVPYYATQYSSAADVIDAFTTGYSDALARAIALDNKITGDAGKISSEYVDLVSLSTHGSVNASDVMVFMRDIGTSSRINPVERMYASFPAFLYLNASLAGAILRPLLQSQSQLALPYAVQDLGLQYPIASGGRGGQSEGVEETGNMLIMMYAHAKASGDGTLLAQNYHLAKKWADYLVSNNNAVLIPNQVSADGMIAANMTNLAIKGIIAVKAMAEISRVFGAVDDANMYDRLQQAHSRTVRELHSWALMYNLYPDVLLGTASFRNRSVPLPRFPNIPVAQPPQLLASQTQYYKSLLQNDVHAACSSSLALVHERDSLRKRHIDQRLHDVRGMDRASYNGVQGAMPDDYQCATGPVVLARQALNVMNSSSINVPFNGSAGTTDSTPTGTGNGNPNGENNNNPKTSNVGPIVGGVVGGVAILVIAGVAFWYFQRLRRASSDVVANPYDRAAPPFSESQLLLHTPAHSPHSAHWISPYVLEVSEASPAPLAPNRRPAPTPAVGPQSSKAREAATNQARHHDATAADSLDPNPMSSDGGRLTPHVGSDWEDGQSATTGGMMLDLREEVEHLRAVMGELREQRLEPPPQYAL